MWPTVFSSQPPSECSCTHPHRCSDTHRHPVQRSPKRARCRRSRCSSRCGTRGLSQVSTHSFLPKPGHVRELYCTCPLFKTCITFSDSVSAGKSLHAVPTVKVPALVEHSFSCEIRIVTEEVELSREMAALKTDGAKSARVVNTASSFIVMSRLSLDVVCVCVCGK